MDDPLGIYQTKITWSRRAGKKNEDQVSNKMTFSMDSVPAISLKMTRLGNIFCLHFQFFPGPVSDIYLSNCLAVGCNLSIRVLTTIVRTPSWQEVVQSWIKCTTPSWQLPWIWERLLAENGGKLFMTLAITRENVLLTVSFYSAIWKCPLFQSNNSYFGF